MIVDHPNLNMDCILSNMVLGDGTWNLDLFHLWLHEVVIRKIIRIPPPYFATSVDRIIWGGTLTGSFSIKSAYEKLRETTWKPKEDMWQIPWKFQGPQRLRFFIRLVFK